MTLDWSHLSSFVCLNKAAISVHCSEYWQSLRAAVFKAAGADDAERTASHGKLRGNSCWNQEAFIKQHKIH